MKAKYQKHTHWLKLAFFMLDKPDWVHIKGGGYKFQGREYDLTDIGFDKLDNYFGDFGGN